MHLLQEVHVTTSIVLAQLSFPPCLHNVLSTHQECFLVALEGNGRVCKAQHKRRHSCFLGAPLWHPPCSILFYRTRHEDPLAGTPWGGFTPAAHPLPENRRFQHPGLWGQKAFQSDHLQLHCQSELPWLHWGDSHLAAWPTALSCPFMAQVQHSLGCGPSCLGAWPDLSLSHPADPGLPALSCCRQTGSSALSLQILTAYDLALIQEVRDADLSAVKKLMHLVNWWVSRQNVEPLHKQREGGQSLGDTFSRWVDFFLGGALRKYRVQQAWWR